MRIANRETGKESERTSRHVKERGKEGTGGKGKVQPKKQIVSNRERGKARQSIFPQIQKLLIAFQ